MNRILCSTGALIGRPNNRDHTLLTKCAERLGCDGFEFMMYRTWYDKIDEIAEFLGSVSKPFPVFHTEKSIGEFISRNGCGDADRARELFEINCRFAERIGSEKLVLHLWSGIESDRDIGNNYSVYPALYEAAAKRGLELTIENVVCNRSDPMTHMHEMAERFDTARFTFDTKMAAFHSQLEDIYRPENAFFWENGLISHLHVNDYGGGHMEWARLKTLHLGSGNIDFERFLRFVKSVGYEGDITVEASSFGADGTIDLDALDRDVGYIGGILR